MLLFHLIFRWIPIKDVMFFAIDISFAICILLGLTYLKTENTPNGSVSSNRLYFVLFLGLSVLWFVFSPLVALHNPLWSMDLTFSVKKFNETYNTYNFFNLYGIVRVLILVPILEEVFYRRIILSSLLEKHGVIFAILVSSSMFSVGHLDFNNSFIFLGFGILLGIIYWKTRNVYYSIILHIFINFLTFFLIEK
jgi:membrane protease YdiL (CAAX protease family)